MTPSVRYHCGYVYVRKPTPKPKPSPINEICQECDTCYWINGNQCLINALERECDAWGDGFVWCGKSPSPINKTCVIDGTQCIGCHWLGGNQCLKNATKEECDAWGNDFVWCETKSNV